MALIKLLKIGADGFNTEQATGDDFEAASFNVEGGGPVLSATGLDLQNQDLSDVKNIDFNDPSVSTIEQTSSPLIIDNIVGKDRENSFALNSAILFPVVSDNVNEVDAFRLPSIAGTPTAAPADGGEGYALWDSSNNKLYVWDGALWDDQSTVDTAKYLELDFTADGALAARDVVQISGNDDVAKAQANALATSDAVGFVVSAAADNAPVKVRLEGEMSGFAGLVAGTRYYLSPSTPGGFTATLPVGAGNYIVQVGQGRNATTMLIDIVPLSRRA